MQPSEILDFADDMQEIFNAASLAITPYDGLPEMKPFIKALNQMITATQKMVESVTYSEENDSDGTCDYIGL